GADPRGRRAAGAHRDVPRVRRGVPRRARAGRSRRRRKGLRDMTTKRAVAPENRGAEAPRDAHGRMLPGTTLNPGGRPKAWAEFREAMRERSPQAVAIVDKALRSRDAEERRWAAEQVPAHAWG